MTVTERFGMRIKELRVQQGISQEELGFRCHLSKNYISDVERGTRNVSLKAIDQFAKGLGIFYFLFEICIIFVSSS